MESIVEALYETLWREPCEEPHYQRALRRWREVRGGHLQEMEDAVNMLEYERGDSSFAAGLRLGMALAHELSL